MALLNSREWLDRVLSSADIDASDVSELVADCPNETETLEFKSGQLKDIPAIAREYCSAFGNAEGGLLLLGYQHSGEGGRFDGIRAPGKTEVEEWLSSAIATLAPHFAPPVRVRTVVVSGQTVGILAIPRAISLVPVIERGVQQFYVRLGTINHPVPAWLLMDLQLGRRRRPDLRVRLHSAKLAATSGGSNPKITEGHLEIALRLENAGLVEAENVRAGVIGWSLESSDVGDALASNVDFVQPDPYQVSSPAPSWCRTYAPLRVDQGVSGSRGAIDMYAFDSINLDVKRIRIPMFPNRLGAPGVLAPDALVERQLRGHVQLRAGVFAIPRGGAPSWYQLTVEHGRAPYRTPGRGPLVSGLEPVEPGDRPVASVRFIDEIEGS